eukprot:COSAG02_NODE_14130_length_1307_cov_0.874172_1_plen_281_part_00
MTGELIEELAASVQDDIDERRPTRLFATSDQGVALSLKDAYRVQAGAARRRKARGEALAGFKIGCTSAAVQKAFGVSQPVRGYIWEGERSHSGAELSHTRYRKPAVEGELAVYVVDSSAPDRLDWVVEWAPVIEMHHFLWDNPTGGTANEIVCRNAIHCGVIEAATEGRPRGLLRDLPADAVCTVQVNGEVVGAQPLTELPGGPQGTVSWLRQQLAAAASTARGNDDEGATVQAAEEELLMQKAGAVILASSPCSLYFVQPGDEVLVTCVGMEVRCVMTT